LAAIADSSHPVGNVMLWKQRGESERAELQGEDALSSAHGVIQQTAVDFDELSVVVTGQAGGSGEVQGCGRGALADLSETAILKNRRVAPSGGEADRIHQVAGPSARHLLALDTLAITTDAAGRDESARFSSAEMVADDGTHK
jgi:hypothetical protein